jgi:hypothetical protein
MGMVKKAWTHLILGTLGALLFLAIPWAAADFPGLWLAAVITVFVLTYLRLQMLDDIARFRSGHVAGNASMLGGCAIGLGIWLIYSITATILFVIVAMILSIL